MDVHDTKLLKIFTIDFSIKYAVTFDFSQTGTSFSLKAEFFFIKALTPGTKSKMKPRFIK